MAQLPTPTQKTVPSDDIRDHVYAGGMLDKVVTSTDLKYTDRLGREHFTVDGMKAEGDKVVEATRQNLIPLSRQYMTLAEAQADISNIPDGSTTYYRSPDASALAIEVMNVGGTLQPTGRRMLSAEPFQGLVDAVLFADPAEFSRSGYASAVVAEDMFIITAVRSDGSFFIPDLDTPGIDLDTLSRITAEITFIDPIEFLRSGYLSAVLSADRYILSAVALDSDVYIPVISDSVGVIESREFARSGFINAVISED
ncbi:TPA: hypothetical protein ACPXR0_001003, partial [Klebsiella pneumoniae]